MNIDSLNKKLRKEIKKILYHNFNWYKGKYIGIHLQGGLCNKLHCLISACDIAINEKSTLIEPYFGWEKKILFSEIYDLNYFNVKMKQFNDCQNIIERRENINTTISEMKSIDNVIDLWEYSERELTIQRETLRIDKNSTKLNVLKALRLKPEFEKIVNAYVNNKKFTAIQIRTESDWVKYAEANQVKNHEKILVPLEEILMMISEFNIEGELFFTSGQNHNIISDEIKKRGIKPHCFFNPSLEYEINAAINFEICCRSDYFIGLSRSSFSNLITLKRASILKNDQSYIYNFKNKILRRKDKGIQYAAESSINKITEII